MLRQLLTLSVSCCLFFLTSKTHGETAPPPPTFTFKLVHVDDHIRCEFVGSPGYRIIAPGYSHFAKQSLSCTFLILPEKDQPVPTFCSLMGLDERISCELRPVDRDGNEYWAVNVSSDTHPAVGVCSVICQNN
jgi:hypothetical protein